MLNLLHFYSFSCLNVVCFLGTTRTQRLSVINRYPGFVCIIDLSILFCIACGLCLSFRNIHSNPSCQFIASLSLNRLACVSWFNNVWGQFIRQLLVDSSSIIYLLFSYLQSLRYFVTLECVLLVGACRELYTILSTQYITRHYLFVTFID